jgi:ribosome-binding ATPase YchF (GTP1/OBG family)
MLVLFNNDEDNTGIPKIDNLTELEKCLVIRGKLEQELARISAEEAAEFLNEFNISESAMTRVIRESYDILGLISFFTVGKDEVRAWTIKNGTQAVDAAEVIHSDIKKGFIRAEVLSYDDLIQAGTYADARKKGTVRLEGKAYEVRDGDIINFRFNV